MWKRGDCSSGAISPLFHIILYIYISNFRSQITYSFVKCGCSIYCVPHSLNSDMISTCFSESLGIRDNGGRLYIEKFNIKKMENFQIKKKIWYFYISAKKNRFRVLVRIAS